MGSDGEEHAHVLKGVALPQQLGDLGGDKAAEAVIEVGAIEGVGGEAAADLAIKDDGITDADAERLDLLLAIFAVELKLDIEHLRGDPLLPRARLGVGEVNRAQRLDGAAL